MKEGLTMQELSELVADAEYKKKNSGVARTTLKLVKAYSNACNQLTEKDTTIKRLEIALFTHQSYDKTASELYEELEQKNETVKELQDEVRKWRTQAEAKILFVANGKEDQMYALQEDNMELWEALQWTLSALTRVTAGEPVFNLDEVIANATRTLQEQERHAALGEGDKEWV